MLKLNRKTEYALLAIQHMYHKEAGADEITNTREISEAYNIPYPLLAKVMQRLAAKGIIKSIQGTKGGYRLAKRPETIVIADVVEIFDGRVAVADCFKDARITCPQWEDCSIKDPLAELNFKIYSLLANTSIKDLAGEVHSKKPRGTRRKEKGVLPVFDDSKGVDSD